MADGISFVVCTRNGAARLPPTFEHLLAQRFRHGVAREILLVDNASTDDTGAVARRLAANATHLPLRIVHEPRRGTGHARLTGLREARYDVVTFVDDDNWLAPDFGQVALDLMRADATLGLLPARCEPVFGAPKPPWFDAWRAAFAVGAQFPRDGDVSREWSNWWSAGLTLRLAAWRDIVELGFRPVLSGRDGRTLGAGEDTEICLALLLAGWRADYDARLRLRHWLPPERLTWNYARRLVFHGPIPAPALSAYRLVLAERTGMRGDPALRSTATATVARRMCRALFRTPRAVGPLVRDRRLDLAQLQLLSACGALVAGLRFGRRYDELVAALRAAAWVGGGPQRVARRAPAPRATAARAAVAGEG